MKCISVYTKDFGLFSEIYEKVMNLPLSEDEETIIEGVMVSESGEVPDHYVERMGSRRDVVVMKDKDQGITILQRDDLFEILLPTAENMVH